MKSSNPSTSMDVISAARFYVDKILSDSSIVGMKALLLDTRATQAVSMVYSQTQILQQEVYLVEQLGKRHERMHHLKAVVYLEPTEGNIGLLEAELKDPQFCEYHVFFANAVSAGSLSRLAQADEGELIRQVQEYYGDFLAVNDDLFHLGLDHSLSLTSSASSSARSLEASRVFEQNVKGILAVLLAVKRRPSQIRYQGASELAKRTASSVLDQIENDDIFDFRRQDGPLLLILDRRDDPITPLLTQWTYQAMVHELLGLNNNRVILRGAPGISKDLEEVVISATQDPFFASQRFANFGDLGGAVKELLDEYQKNAKMNENIASLEDMQAFMERYPAFRSHALNVSKHVALMGELARLTDVYHLLDISQLEQEIACSSDHSGHKRELMEKINSSAVQKADKLRLALLYMIKYESYNELNEIKSALNNNSVDKVFLLDAMLQYAGDHKRASGLFSQGGLMAKLGKTISSSVNGVENVYTQHVPLLQNTLEAISKGKLKDSAYPLASGGGGPSGKPMEVIVFMVGGVTYEEAMSVAAFNKANQLTRVILGGSCIQNSTSFLEELKLSCDR
jgi:vacuolar protein sorting-associated protein 45